MASITWMFVQSPETPPSILLNMNQENGSILLDMGKKFDLSPPARRKSFATNSMVDGSLLTSSSADNRVLTFSIALQGTIQQKIDLLRALTRELSKSQNLIMYQPDKSISPVFFRTMRSDEYVIVNRGGRAGAWGIDCQVLAEPYAISPRVDLASNVVVRNDPAATDTDNPCFIDLNGIIGDVPSPAFAKFYGMGQSRPVWIASRTRLVDGLQHFAQAENCEVLGTDTARWTAPSDFSTGNNLNYVYDPKFVKDVSEWIGTNCLLDRVTTPLAPGATASMRITPNGSSATGNVTTITRTARYSVESADKINIKAWLMSPGELDAAHGVFFQINWYDDDNGDLGVLLSTSSGTATALTANTWTELNQTLTSPSFSTSFTISIAYQGTPPANPFYVWNVRATRDDSTTASNMIAVSFSTNALLNPRLHTLRFPFRDALAMSGRYRVLARVGTGTDGTSYQLRTEAGYTNRLHGRLAEFTLTTDVSRVYIDLGLLYWPSTDLPPTIGYSGKTFTGVDEIRLGLLAARIPAAGNLDIDHVYLLPADEQVMCISAPSSDGGMWVILDGPNDSAYMMQRNNDPLGPRRQQNNFEYPLPFQGSIPDLVPGVTNRWHILSSGQPTTNNLTFGSISYWPKWYEVATP